MSKSKVYFTKEITPESLLRIYDCLGVQLKGKVAVKISSGEPGGHYYLDHNLIKNLVSKVHGTIVETLTIKGFPSKRNTVKDHWQTLQDHGFKAIAPCDLLDEEGEVEMPVYGGKHLKSTLVGTHMKNYNSSLVLSHFKGHAMGGFGGALKNVAIGYTSYTGKVRVHSGGKIDDYTKMKENFAPQDDFLETMAEAAKTYIEFFKPENMAYVNVANNLSIDCDCDANPHPPEMADIGIYASLDPVALDQCCYDAVMNSTDKGKAALVKRMTDLHAIHICEEANRLGLGSRQYELINIDK